MELINVLSTIVRQLCGTPGNLTVGVITYSLFAVLICFSFTIKNYKNVKLSDDVRKDIEAFKANGETFTGKSSKLQNIFRVHNYVPLMNALCTFVQAIFGFFLSLALKGDYSGIKTGFLAETDIRLSVYSYVRDGGTPLTVSFAVAMLSIILQFLHNKLLEQRLITDEGPLNTALTVMCAVGLIFAPCGVSLFWIIIQLTNLAIMFFNIRKNDTLLATAAGIKGETDNKSQIKAKKKNTESQSSKYDC